MTIFSQYQTLFSQYGSINFWPQWCSSNKTRSEREFVVIGALLTQHTSWLNVEKALKNLLDKNLLSLEKIAKSTEKDLVDLIRPAGFYTTKPRKLITLAKYIQDNGGIEEIRKKDIVTLRSELLQLYGVGPETADTILLYALDLPSFVIDAYTVRFCQKYKLADKFEYQYLKDLFEKNLPRDVSVYQNYHIYIIADSKGIEKTRMGTFEIRL